MPDFYISVTVIEKRKLKIDFTAEEKPKDNDALLELIQNEEYNDITDEETLEIQSVEEVEYLTNEEAEESDDE